MVKQRDITIPDGLESCQALLQNLAHANHDLTHVNAAKDQQLRDQDQQLRDQDIKGQQQEQQYEKLSQEYEELQLAYNKLLQQRFGNRSERYIEDPDQLRLDFGNTDEAADAALGLRDAVEELEQTIPEHKRRKARQKRDEGLPEHLPRYEVTADVPDEQKQCDAHGEIERAGCNSHARRKIRDSIAYPADRKRWLLWFQELYDMEDRGKVMSPEQRLELRQSEAKPIWDAMAVWLEEVKLRTCNVILPKSDFAQALQYIRNHFVELKRYLDDPWIPIDNNETEQLMKQVALGRKNWLFAGSVAGGERTAGFLTLVSSALRNDLDVWQYVKDVLDQLLAGVTDYEPLLPWNWAANHPEAIRHYRVGERKERTDRKRFKRENRRRDRKQNR